jgi:BRO family, N-terminal domain
VRTVTIDGEPWVVAADLCTILGLETPRMLSKECVGQCQLLAVKKVIMQDNPIYLGDAVYAFYDGNGTELKLNHHTSPCLIYLEPEVMEALIAFWNKATSAAEASPKRNEH